MAAMLRQKGRRADTARRRWLWARRTGCARGTPKAALVNPASMNLFDSPAGLLTIAVRHDRPEMLAMLLDFGFDPDERTRLEGLERWSTRGACRCGIARFGASTRWRRCCSNVERTRTGRCTPAARRCGMRISQHDSAMVELLKRYGGVVLARNGGLLPADGAGQADASGRGRRPLAGRDGPAREDAGGGSAGQRGAAAAIRRSCGWRWSGSTGRATIRDGTGCCGRSLRFLESHSGPSSGKPGVGPRHLPRRVSG